MKTFRLLIVSLLLATSASAQHHRGERRGGDYSPTVYLISVHEVDTIYNCGGCAAQQAAARNRMAVGNATQDYIDTHRPGFQQVEIIDTDGKPGVFATLDAGAEKTVGLYFMYDVKQYDESEWSSPPLEARIVDKAGKGAALLLERHVLQEWGDPSDHLPDGFAWKGGGDGVDCHGFGQCRKCRCHQADGHDRQ